MKLIRGGLPSSLYITSKLNIYFNPSSLFHGCARSDLLTILQLYEYTVVPILAADTTLCAELADDFAYDKAIITNKINKIKYLRRDHKSICSWIYLDAQISLSLYLPASFPSRLVRCASVSQFIAYCVYFSKSISCKSTRSKHTASAILLVSCCCLFSSCFFLVLLTSHHSPHTHTHTHARTLWIFLFTNNFPSRCRRFSFACL